MDVETMQRRIKRIPPPTRAVILKETRKVERSKRYLFLSLLFTKPSEIMDALLDDADAGALASAVVYRAED